MMRVLIPILIAFIFTMSAPCLATALDVPSEEIKEAAKLGFKEFITNRLIDKGFQSLGFRNQTDLDNAELGEGFPIYNIDIKKLMDETAPMDLQPLVVPTDQWHFFITARGRAISMLKLALINGKWSVYGIGASPLANEIQGLQKTRPASSGFSFRVIRLSQFASTYIELLHNGKSVGLIPLTQLILKPGRETGTYTPDDLQDPKDILPSLRNSIKQYIDDYKNENKNN